MHGGGHRRGARRPAWSSSRQPRPRTDRFDRRLHRSALLRRHPLLRPDGLLPRLAAPHAARPVAGHRRRVRRAARAEVGRRRERRRAGRSAGPLRYRQGAIQAGVRRRHAAHVPSLPRRASGRRAAGRRVRQQAARGLGDAGVGAHSGRLRRGRVVADPDGAGQQGRGRRAPVVLHLAGLPETPRNGPSRLGQPGAGRHAGERHRTPAGLLGRRSFADRTSSGRRPDRRWRRSAGIRWSRWPTPRAGS